MFFPKLVKADWLVTITTASTYILVWALCQGLDQVTLENCVFRTVADNVVQECTWMCHLSVCHEIRNCLVMWVQQYYCAAVEVQHKGKFSSP